MMGISGQHPDSYQLEQRDAQEWLDRLDARANEVGQASTRGQQPMYLHA